MDNFHVAKLEPKISSFEISNIVPSSELQIFNENVNLWHDCQEKIHA